MMCVRAYDCIMRRPVRSMGDDIAAHKAILRAFEGMHFQARGGGVLQPGVRTQFVHVGCVQGAEETWVSFRAKIVGVGALVEAFMEPGSPRGAVSTPSVQVYLDNHGGVHVMGSHEQEMDASGQCFQGSSFPAKDAYRCAPLALVLAWPNPSQCCLCAPLRRAAILQHGKTVGKRLVEHKAMGWYSVDFLAGACTHFVLSLVSAAIPASRAQSAMMMTRPGKFTPWKSICGRAAPRIHS